MAREIQSRCIQGLGVEPPLAGVVGKAQHEPGGLVGRHLPKIKYFSEFVKVPNSLGILITKLTVSQKLKIVELSKVVINPFQNISHLLGRKKLAIFYIILKTLKNHILKTKN